MAGYEAPAVGIDLGTTYSCMGVWRKGEVYIITNEQGNRTTPSCVAFNDKECLIGEGAINQAARNPTNTVFDVKRLIGRRFSDEVVQSDMKLWPFKVISGEEDRPAIVVNYMNEEKHFSAEEISSMVLYKMKEIATAYFDRPVEKAVVTVPAYFNNSQRQATKDAAAIAGLDVMQILNEPTAAALAYGLNNKETCRHGDRRSILVFDLGGGMLDVSLLELDGHGTLEVKATCGDTHLGGQDFDNRMVEFLLRSYKEKHSQDPSEDPRSVRKLKAACEKAKRVLSFHTVTFIDIDNFYRGEDFCTTFTRARFDELNKDLFDKCMAPLEQCLRDAGVGKMSVDEVVLVGGSTRIPRIQEMLSSFFEGKKLYMSIRPDLAVAYGASIQAAILNGDKKKDPEAPKLKLLDITPLSLGIEDGGDKMRVVIPKGTRIPCVREEVYYTTEDNPTSLGFAVLEGEKTKAADDNLMGQFRLMKAPAGEIKFKVIFNMDADGILTVTVRNEDNKEETGMTITRDKFTLRQEEIYRMRREAKIYELQDKERKANLARGIDDTRDMMSVMIPKGTRIPCMKERVYTTPKHNVTSLRFKVLEGERTMAADNKLLGEFVASSIRPAPAGEIKFKVIFSVDVNGILIVTLRNEDNKEEKITRITRDKFTQSQDEIDRVIREARMYQLRDMARRAELLRSG